MCCRSLGWAGIEVEHDGASLVIGALADPTATYAALGRAAADVTFPKVFRRGLPAVRWPGL